MTDKKNEPEKVESEEKTQRLEKVRVTGANTKAAKLQTGHLKWKDGEPLPEFEEEECNDE